MVTKYFTGSNLREKGLYRLFKVIQSIMVEKVQQQECGMDEISSSVPTMYDHSEDSRVYSRKTVPPSTDYASTLVSDVQKHRKLTSAVNKTPISAPGFSGPIILKFSGFDIASPPTCRKTEFSYYLALSYITSKFQ